MVEKRTVSYPKRGRDGGGVSEEPLPMHLLLAICSGEGEEARVFLRLEEEEGKERLWPMKRLQCRWGDL